jgi:hypothetical protein
MQGTKKGATGEGDALDQRKRSIKAIKASRQVPSSTFQMILRRGFRCFRMVWPSARSGAKPKGFQL